MMRGFESLTVSEALIRRVWVVRSSQNDPLLEIIAFADAIAD